MKYLPAQVFSPPNSNLIRILVNEPIITLGAVNLMSEYQLIESTLLGDQANAGNCLGSGLDDGLRQA